MTTTERHGAADRRPTMTGQNQNRRRASGTLTPIVRPLRCLPMESLGRMIADWDQRALDEWITRYGHPFPVYAIVDGREMRLE